MENRIKAGNSVPNKTTLIISASLFFLYTAIVMNIFNAINLQYIHDLSLSSKQFGLLSASYYLANILFLLPAGIIVDKYSPRKCLLIAFSSSILFTILFSISNYYYLSILIVFCLGISSTFCYTVPMKIVSLYIQKDKVAFYCGLIILIGMLGGVMSQLPCSLLTDKYGWSLTVKLLALFGLIILLISYKKMQINTTAKQTIKLDHLKILYKNKQNWIIGLIMVFFDMPMSIFGSDWGINYLHFHMHMTQTVASLITSILFIGMMIGLVIIPLIIKTFKSIKLNFLFGSILMIIIILQLNYSMMINNIVFIVASLFLILGFISALQVLGYTLILKSNPIEIAASSQAFASILVMLSGTFFQPLFGMILDISRNNLSLPSIGYTNATGLLIAGMIINLILIRHLLSFYSKEI